MPIISARKQRRKICSWYREIPVSYTHLDVYKRQDLDSPASEHLVRALEAIDGVSKVRIVK